MLACLFETIKLQAKCFNPSKNAYQILIQIQI